MYEAEPDQSGFLSAAFTVLLQDETSAWNVGSSKLKGHKQDASISVSTKSASEFSTFFSFYT